MSASSAKALKARALESRDFRVLTAQAWDLMISMCFASIAMKPKLGLQLMLVKIEVLREELNALRFKSEARALGVKNIQIFTITQTGKGIRQYVSFGGYPLRHPDEFVDHLLCSNEAGHAEAQIIPRAPVLEQVIGYLVVCLARNLRCLPILL